MEAAGSLLGNTSATCTDTEREPLTSRRGPGAHALSHDTPAQEDTAVTCTSVSGVRASSHGYGHE